VKIPEHPKSEINMKHPSIGVCGPLIWVIHDFGGPILRRIEGVRHLESQSGSW
jgi:hypothetical protein